MAAAGATVVPSARTAAEVEAVADEARDFGGEARGITADVTDDDDVEALVEEIVDAFGSLDILVNNAGFNPGDALGDPAEIESDAVDSVLDVNLEGRSELSEPPARTLKEAGGSVVNVASVAGEVGLPKQHPYVASKHGLVGLTKSAAMDWAPEVRVNAVAPGYVATDLTGDATGERAAAVDPRPDTPRSLRRSDGDRGTGRLPRERRGEFRHRRDARRRRRLDGAVVTAARSRPRRTRERPGRERGHLCLHLRIQRIVAVVVQVPREEHLAQPGHLVGRERAVEPLVGELASRRRLVPSDQLRAARVPLPRGERRHQLGHRRVRIALVVPEQEQPAEIGERVAERRQLPVEDGDDRRGVRGRTSRCRA